jgi:hypothetical protein
VEKVTSQSLVEKTKALFLKKYGKTINDEEAQEILRKLSLFARLLLKTKSIQSPQINSDLKRENK